MAGAESHLSSILSALRRWPRFCEARKLSVASPSPADLAAFLREVSVSAGGPTAAASVYQAFFKLPRLASGLRMPKDPS